MATMRHIMNKLHRHIDRIEMRADSCKLADFLYRHILIPPMVRLFKWGGIARRRRVIGKGYWESWHNAEQRLSSPEEMRRLEKDIIASYLMYRIDPEEYFMYDFPHKGRKERLTYLSDFERMHVCNVKMGRPVFLELKDKAHFHQLAAPFFKRDVCSIAYEDDWAAFRDFTQRHSRFFLKINAGTFGAGCSVVDSPADSRELFEKLLSSGNSWVAEELIEQTETLAAWNPSSVNTIRICSFREGERNKIGYTFIRTGRKGSIVDNGGAGGIFASVDPVSGIINTDGADEAGNVFPVHPDSGVPYKGVQIPEWQGLLDLAKQVHGSLPDRFFYVGFDFAHTKNGWVLVEGNWGQFVAQQVTLRKGLRASFEQTFGMTKLQALDYYRQR